MRYLIEHDRDDRGVASIFIILAIVALLVGAAFAIDVGRFVVEAQSAQNSADATVLAMATDCAQANPGADYSAHHETDQSIAPTAPACAGDSVSVTVTTPMTDGLLVRHDRDEVQRRATARWGNLGTATGTFPITLSTCVYSLAAGGIPGSLPSAEVTMHGNVSGGGCNGGPGQFGFVKDGCSTTATVSATGDLPGTTGNNLQGTGCSTDGRELDLYMTTDAFGLGIGNVLVPIWDSYSAAGYHIAGFALFHLTGYSLQGNKANGTLGMHCDDGSGAPKDTNECVRGYVMDFVTQQGSVGGSDFGAKLVYLSD